MVTCRRIDRDVDRGRVEAAVAVAHCVVEAVLAGEAGVGCIGQGAVTVIGGRAVGGGTDRCDRQGITLMITVVAQHVDGDRGVERRRRVVIVSRWRVVDRSDVHCYGHGVAGATIAICEDETRRARHRCRVLGYIFESDVAHQCFGGGERRICVERHNEIGAASSAHSRSNQDATVGNVATAEADLPGATALIPDRRLITGLARHAVTYR